MFNFRDSTAQVMNSSWFPSDMMFGIQAKYCNFLLENFASHGMRVQTNDGGFTLPTAPHLGQLPPYWDVVLVGSRVVVDPLPWWS